MTQGYQSDDDIDLGGSLYNRASFIGSGIINQWSGAFKWDKDISDANSMIFGNESFRENQ